MDMDWKLVALFVLLLLNLSNAKKRRLPPYAPGNRYDQFECQSVLCPYGYFNCDCEKPRSEYLVSSRCVPLTWTCDGYEDCEDGSDEFQCSCPENEIQCSVCDRGSGCSGNVTFDLYHCARMFKTNDGEKDCLSLKDEPRRFPECVYCDGIIDCPHLTPHDEANCTSCPASMPNRCDCNVIDDVRCNGRGQVCYSDIEKCDRFIDCTDASDEMKCACAADEFMCQCYKKTPTTCFNQDRCIPVRQFHDGAPNCPDGSDETPYLRVAQCGNCNVTIYRLRSKRECDARGFPSCDSSTCYTVPSLLCTTNRCSETQVICTSHCPNHGDLNCSVGFQCADGSLALAHQFCDGSFDCPDNSDEMTNKPGLECVRQARKCVLPQQNLFDAIPHCPDESDLCMSANHSCFQCLNEKKNKFLVSSTQVCNGVINCPDASDECLCDRSSEIPTCQYIFDQSPVLCEKRNHDQKESDILEPISLPLRIPKISRTFQIECQAKWGMVVATLCDGRPECNDFRDECNCKNVPSFCNDTCHSFYLLGDRYCDGVEDEAWKFIKDPACPKGFDERSCPKRFKCKAKNRISIDVGQICDGVRNCDDGSDEGNCTQSSSKTIFSSQTEMIEHGFIRGFFWFFAIVALCGNVYVFVAAFKHLQKEKMKEAMRFQYTAIINIAIADFFMGIYLLIIAIQSVRYSGKYDKVDYYWRTSSVCASAGTLAFISSEAACFFIVILTAFMSLNVCRSTGGTFNTVWKLFLGLGWVIAVLLATLPTFSSLSDYFLRSVWVRTPFSKRTMWSNEDLELFSCRLASISYMPEKITEQYSSKAFLENNYPEFLPQGEFGYFSFTSICLPDIYVTNEEKDWKYTFALITTNFICYVFVAVNYFMICKISAKRHEDVEDHSLVKHESQLQRRVARIIFTNLICWTIITIIAYSSHSGVILDKALYVVSFVFLFPINSAINPLLFSSLPEKVIKLLCCRKVGKLQLF